MAFVKIRKGNKRHVVPYGAYLKQYAPQGWELSGKAKTPIKPVVTNVTEESEGEEEWQDKESKSLEEMNVAELKELAEEKGIDTRSLKTVGALRNAIKNA